MAPTVIGSSIVVDGEISGDEDLIVEGRVEGSITLSKTLTIETNGVVHANISARNAVISGALVGNVKAEESVHVTEEGRVVGDIAAPRVVLVDGASFRGSIDMGEPGAKTGQDVLSTEKAVAQAPTGQTPGVVGDKAEATPEQAPIRVRRAPAAQQAARSAEPSSKSETKAPPDKPDAPKHKPAPPPKVRSVGKTKAAVKRSR